MNPKSNPNKPMIFIAMRNNLHPNVFSVFLFINILLCSLLTNAQTYTTIANGNWNNAATWQGGAVPSTNNPAGATIRIAHTITYNVLSQVENRGDFRIEPLSGTVAKIIMPSGINITNFPTGRFYVINGEFHQSRFVGGGNTGSPQSGSFKNIGGYIEIVSSFIEVAQDWTSESNGVRIMRNSCLYGGQNYSISGSSSIDTLIGVHLSLGWHGAGNVQISDASIYFSGARFQLAGSSGSFNLSSGTASGDIDYITLKNHVTSTIGSGEIFASSSLSVLTGLNLDAYCVSNASKYLPNGKYSGTQSFDCSLLYFPSQCVNVDFGGIDVGITKTVNSVACVRVNNTRVFTLTATNNNADFMATGVTVDDLLPVGLTFVSASGTGSYNSATGVWTVGTLLPLQTKTITITSTISSAPPTIITNTATLGSMDQVDVNASNNSASVTLTVCPITFTGTVYDDANGLLNNTVNGVGEGTPDNVQTYISLVNASTGNVERVRAVSADGTYTFNNITTNSNYTLVLSTVRGAVGQPDPATSLPSNWVYIGENIGNLAGNDGLADGRIALTVGVSNILDINFGINKLPDSDNKTYFIPVPTSDTMYRLNGSSAIPGPLSGTDLEDGILGSSRNVEITSLPTNGCELYYNNVKITFGADGINPPSNTNPFRISNYKIDSLAIKIFPAPGALPTSFNYVFLMQQQCASRRLLPTVLTCTYCCLLIF